jgi:predicted enzyme related to lactoylglutathione lyase
MGSPVTHWQILAKDPDKQSAFYGRLFGWKVAADNALGYRMVDTGSDLGIGGGFWPAGPEGRAMVQLFIAVDDVAKSADDAVKLGATVIIPRQALPEGGELAILMDPEGNPFGLAKAGRPL